MDRLRGGVFSGAMVLAGISATLLSALIAIGIRQVTIPGQRPAPLHVRPASGEVAVPDATASPTRSQRHRVAVAPTTVPASTTVHVPARVSTGGTTSAATVQRPTTTSASGATTTSASTSSYATSPSTTSSSAPAQPATSASGASASASPSQSSGNANSKGNGQAKANGNGSPNGGGNGHTH